MGEAETMFRCSCRGSNHQRLGQSPDISSSDLMVKYRRNGQSSTNCDSTEVEYFKLESTESEILPNMVRISSLASRFGISSDWSNTSLFPFGL